MGSERGRPTAPEGHTMPYILALFTVAYGLMIYSTCQLLRSGTRQVEADYPLTTPPRGKEK